MLEFAKIDMDTWARREHYIYYTEKLKIEFNMTANRNFTRCPFAFRCAACSCRAVALCVCSHKCAFVSKLPCTLCFIRAPLVETHNSQFVGMIKIFRANVKANFRCQEVM